MFGYTTEICGGVAGERNRRGGGTGSHRLRLSKLLLLVLLFPPLAHSQVCRLTVAGLNRARTVTGPVMAECPGTLIVHTAPFGNWGVTSNFGPKLNGHQFQGWCRDTPTCDNSGRCRTNCQDGWYEWNSCTEHAAYKAPNCTLYNSANCTEQVSITGTNVLGTQTVDLIVSCPADSNGDGIADAGGCRDVTAYSHGSNFMSLYELDPAGPDELIQTLYFPETPVNLTCTVSGCPPAGSEWVSPSFAQSPAFPIKVYAEFATVVGGGEFKDPSNICSPAVATLKVVSAASFQSGAFAADSIASAFGNSLATATAAASGASLPQSLLGTSVIITDAGGVSRTAPLYFVSPGQVNYLYPSEIPTGEATVEVRSGNGNKSSSKVRVQAAAPGLFTANADGRGVAAANAVSVGAGGAQTPVAVFACGQNGAGCVPVAIDLGKGESTYISFYGTGVRHASTVKVLIDGLESTVSYAGPQGEFAGLDQMNVLLPAELAGRGVVTVDLVADGYAANPVTILVR